MITPETVRVVTGYSRRANGTVVQKFSVAKNLVKDVTFEEAKEYSGYETENSESGGN